MIAGSSRHFTQAFLGLFALAALATVLSAADPPSDEEYEEAFGLDKALADPATLLPVEGVHEQWFAATGCCDNEECRFSFTFSKAYAGTFLLKSQGDRPVRGAYVKITMSSGETECCDCDRIRFIQTARKFEVSEGRKESVSPGLPLSRPSGWSDEDEPSRGWFVDMTPFESKPPFRATGSPYADTRSDMQAGVPGERPAVLRDPPASDDAVREGGKEFYTCAICSKEGRANRVIACVHWGYRINPEGNVSFDPNSPEASCEYPRVFQDAVERWRRIGRDSSGIDFPE